MSEKMQKIAKTRYPKIDNIKAALIILVVFGHFIYQSVASNKTSFTVGLLFSIYIFHMPAFMIISGLNSRNFALDIKKSIISIFELVIIYIVFKFIVAYFEYIPYNMPSRFPDLLHESGAPWFLMALIFYKLLLFPISALLKNKGKQIKTVLSITIFIVMLVSSLVLGYLKGVNDFLSLDRVIAFMPFFFFGYFFLNFSFDNRTKFIQVKEKVASVMFVAYVVFTFIFFYKCFYAFNLTVFGAFYDRCNNFKDLLPFLAYPELYVRLVWYVFALIISLCFFCIFDNEQHKFFTNIGKNSLYIYIIHRPLKDIFLTLPISKVFDASNPIHLIIMALFCIGLCIFISECIEISKKYIIKRSLIIKSKGLKK